MRLPTPFWSLLAAGALLSPAGPASAQVEADPVLSGAVRLGSAADAPPPEGVQGETVVLHRVGTDSAGEIDSVRVSPDGSFSLRLPSVPGGTDDVFFASVEHHGILYFGDPITTAARLDSAYVITVHDTAAAPAGGATLPVTVRYLVLEPAAAPGGSPDGQGGEWRMTDLIEVENPGDRTLVGGEGGTVWSYPLPPAARRIVIGQTDVGPDAAAVEDGRLVVRAPLPPGRSQFLLRYALPSPELTVPLPGSTGGMELLVREPAPPLRVEGLGAAEPVAMEAGTTYRRYAGADLEDGSVEVLEGTEETTGAFSPRWLAVALGLVLGGVGLYAVLRRRGTPARAGGRLPPAEPGQAGAAGDRAALLLEVARIDERLEEGGADAAEAERLREHRAALVERLRKA